MREYLQREAGAGATGQPTETLSVHYGSGGNGKSKFWGAVMHTLGDDAAVSDKSLLIKMKYEPHATVVADMFRKRLAVASETSNTATLNDTTVKNLTGGDQLSARRMREDPWKFWPTHPMVMFSNHRPTVEGRDDGIWRRLRLVPWEVTIPDGERDDNLAEKLRGEASGILRWIVQGARRFLAARKIDSRSEIQGPFGTLINMGRRDDPQPWPTVSFAMPLEKKPWLAVLHFVSRAGVIELVEAELTYADLDQCCWDAEASDEAQDALGKWLRTRMSARGKPMWRDAPAGGLSVRQLRGIRFGSLQTEARRLLAQIVPVFEDSTLFPKGWAAEARRRSGPAGKSDTHYALIAAAYEELVNAGVNNLIVELARRQSVASKKAVSPKLISNQLATAVGRGLLKRGVAGRAEGSLTDKGRAALAEEV